MLMLDAYDAALVLAEYFGTLLKETDEAFQETKRLTKL
jgi:hypothetical protein